MADERDQLNDEYQFSELEDINPELEGEENTATRPPKSLQTPTNVRRNAIIAIAVILLSMLAYKIIGSFLMHKSSTSIQTPQQPKFVQSQPTPKSSVIQEQTPAPSVITPTPRPVISEEHIPPDRILQSLATVAENQRELRAGIDPLSGQLSNVDRHISDLADKIGELTNAISALSSKIEQQTAQIEAIIVRSKPRPTRCRVRKGNPAPVYAIQAIIPGRAWLISKNGSTITVNVGSQVSGYGVVKLIDSRQGKVITSSGRIIQFGRQDS